MCSLEFKIDEEKCIHCGQCIKDCMAKIITFNENKIPTVIDERENSCIKCQHCLAVCPTGALSILGKYPECSEVIHNDFNTEEVLRLIKSRKSIRHYKKENVEKDTLEKLKEMLDYVPTGVNNHTLHFSIIDDISVMDKVREQINKLIVKIISNNTVKAITKKFSRYTNAILKGEDIIFRGAPHMIVVSSKKDAPCKDIDGIISLAYFELYAKSLGLGTCWCGLAYYCLKYFPKFKRILGVPKTHDIAYVMLFGYPDIEYKRTTQPDRVKINIVEDIPKEHSKLINKIKNIFNNVKKA